MKFKLTEVKHKLWPINNKVIIIKQNNNLTDNGNFMVSFMLNVVKFLLVYRHLQNIYWFKRVTILFACLSIGLPPSDLHTNKHRIVHDLSAWTFSLLVLSMRILAVFNRKRTWAKSSICHFQVLWMETLSLFVIVPHISMRRILFITCGMQPSGCRFSIMSASLGIAWASSLSPRLHDIFSCVPFVFLSVFDLLF